MRLANLGLTLLFAGAAIGCTTSDDDRPVEPGGGGPIGVGSGGGTQTFHVCLVTDLRAGSSCATTGAGGMQVALGSSVATTADDGSFQIAVPQETGLSFVVTSPTTVTSIQQFSNIPSIPAISATDYSSLLAQQDTTVQETEGSVVIGAVMGGKAASGVGLTTVPDTTPFFDQDASPYWNPMLDVTGSTGSAWMTNVPVGSITATMMPPSTGSEPVEPVVSTLPVMAGAITFGTVALQEDTTPTS